MKNLFDFATKELSQDAFLRWLFENYNCENESVRLACRKLFDSFTSEYKEHLDFDKITKLDTLAQWKNIDIVIRFEIDAQEYWICIEDKTESKEHNQLEIYNKQLELSNTNCRYVFKIFYKTNIIDIEERQRVEKQHWRIYDIFDIVPLFSNIDATSEVLAYYIESINSILSNVSRTTPPDEWNLTAWHSFFNDYKPIPHIADYKEIDCYQKAYFYLKLFAEGHLTDMPCLEIRSRDFKKIDGGYSITARVVLYNYKGTADKETIEAWQTSIENKIQGFVPSYRTDVSRHKQIGKITRVINNTESELISAINEMSQALL